jgi:outer membrane protein OmpA-like peptidoglycan-associated protein
MVSNVLDVERALDAASDPTRFVEHARKRSSGSAWRWVVSGVAALGVSALAAYLLRNPLDRQPSQRAALLPASLYFDSAGAALDEHSEALVAVAAAARISPTPVVVTAYADPVGNRSRNLHLARKRAADVRDALVTAGVPTLRVVLVSPTFASTSEERRVEVSAVQGVPAFPTQRDAEAR